jgi:hypothetical protein
MQLSLDISGRLGEMQRKFGFYGQTVKVFMMPTVSKTCPDIFSGYARHVVCRIPVVAEPKSSIIHVIMHSSNRVNPTTNTAVHLIYSFN